jgi:BASS family bile acid:Na+ symporter
MLSLLSRPLAWIGRYGTQSFAISIFIGLALPQFSAAARPLLPISIFVFVMLTFARADPAALMALLRNPRPLLLAAAWLIVMPLCIIGGGLSLIGRETLDPGLVLGVAILAAAPPIMSGPSIAMLLGLNPTLILAAVLVTTALSPLISPILVELVAGAAVPLDMGVLIQRLLIFIGGAIIAAFALRAWLGGPRIEDNKEIFDGIGVLMYLLFAVAAMDGVMAAAMAMPGTVAVFLVIAFALSFAGFGLAWLILRSLGKADRFVLGYGTCQRNMGLLIAALGAATPPTTFLFFALAQFPIYLMPQIMKPLAARLRGDQTAAPSEPVHPRG